MRRVCEYARQNGHNNSYRIDVIITEHPTLGHTTNICESEIAFSVDNERYMLHKLRLEVFKERSNQSVCYYKYYHTEN